MSDASILEVGKEIGLEALCESLISYGYTRSEAVEGMGQFATRGDILDVFIPDYESPVRAEFFGDEIDRITEIDVLTGEIIDEIGHVAIFPASHYVVSKENMERAIRDIEVELEEQIRYFKGEDKLLEAQRISEELFVFL
jgi:excinuclease ABC subunit B